MPVRRWLARDRQTRCARPRGCSVRRSALRGRRHPGRPRHLLLSTASAHGAHIPGRRSRATPPNSAAGASPAKAVPSCGCVMRILARSRYSMMATSPDGRLSTTGTPRSTRRPCIAARCSWIGHRAASTSSIRSTVAATTSVWPSISDLTSRRNSKSLARSWTGPPHPHPGPRGWNCRRGCGGASTGMRPIPSSAGTPRAWVGAFLLLRSLGCGRCVPGMPLITRLEFLDVGKSGKSAVSRQAISWTTSAALSERAREIQAEAR